MPIEPPSSPWRLPPPRAWPDSDLVGIGAEVDPGTMLQAYRSGIFPMRVEGSLGWWSPVERGVLPLRSLRVSRSLRQSMKHFDIRVDTACHDVIRGCADPSRDGAWTGDDYVCAYGALHRRAWPNTVEAWGS